MSILDIIRARHSVRRYLDTPVEEEKILQILEAARLAPSWRNQQCWKFIVIKDPLVRKNIIQQTGTYNQGWLGSAPTIIVACGDPAASGIKNNQNYYLVDVAIAVEHLVLAATELGLGTCWIGTFDAEKMKEILNIPQHIEIVMLTPLGYPTEKEGLVGKIARTVVRSKKRKDIEQIFCYDKWQ